MVVQLAMVSVSTQGVQMSELALVVQWQWLSVVAQYLAMVAASAWQAMALVSKQGVEMSELASVVQWRWLSVVVQSLAVVAAWAWWQAGTDEATRQWRMQAYPCFRVSGRWFPLSHGRGLPWASTVASQRSQTRWWRWLELQAILLVLSALLIMLSTKSELWWTEVPTFPKGIYMFQPKKGDITQFWSSWCQKLIFIKKFDCFLLLLFFPD